MPTEPGTGADPSSIAMRNTSVLPVSSGQSQASDSTIIISNASADDLTATDAVGSATDGPTFVVVTHAGERLDAENLTLEVKEEIMEALQRSGVEGSEITTVVIENPTPLESTAQTVAPEQVCFPALPSIWNKAAVHQLMVLHKEYENLFEDPKFKKKLIWDMMSERFRREGFDFTSRQVETKWKSLTCQYRNAVDHNAVHGHISQKSSPFFNEMALVYDYKSPYSQQQEKEDQSSSLSQTAPAPKPAVVVSQSSAAEQSSAAAVSRQLRPASPSTAPVLSMVSAETVVNADSSDPGMGTSLPNGTGITFSTTGDTGQEETSAGQKSSGPETESDLKQVLGLLRVLHRDREEQERERIKLLEKMHREKMAMFGQFMDVLKDLKANLGRRDSGSSSSKDFHTSQMEFDDDSGGLEFAQKVNDSQKTTYENGKNPANPITAQDCRVSITKISGEKRYSCDICGKLFEENSALRKHKRTHTEEKPYTCDMCNMKFRLSGQLRQHKKTHMQGTPYVCDVCGKGFKHPTVMIRHKHTHTGIKPHACTECGKKFARSDDLKTHHRVHVKEYLYQCDVCGKGFKHKVNLQRHLTIHTDVRHYNHWCDVCGKGFSTRSHLKEHYLTHTGEKPFVCDVCGKGFTSKSLVKRHKFNHLAEKPFKCEVCGKGFITKSHVKRHVRDVHDDVKPHVCDFCNFAFESRRDLQIHKSIHEDH